MPTPARFPNGLTNRAVANPLGGYGLPDPSSWVTYFDDFFTYTAANWIVTETTAGATQALSAGTTLATSGGQLLLTTEGNDNDEIGLQLLVAPFFLTRGKKAVFRVKFRASNATEMGIMFGLVPTDAAPFDFVTSSTVTAGIYFFKADDGTSVLGHVEDANTITATAAMGTLVAATNTEWAWAYNGREGDAGEVKWFIDNVHVGTTTTLTNFPLVQLNMIMAFHNGSGAIRTLTVDHILAAQER